MTPPKPLSLGGAVLAAAALACGGGTPSSGPAAAVVITPGTASVLIGGEARFEAATAGGGTVTWSVVEGDAGGTISEQGRYVAPAAPGTFHVRATSPADPARPGVAAVTVHPYARAISRVADGSSARDHHTATLVGDGTVLVVGGAGASGAVAAADRYEPAARAFRPGGVLGTPRLAHGAAPLPDGRVLVAGGWDPGSPGTAFDPVLRSSELWDPATATFAPGPDLVFPRRHATFTTLPDGRVFVAGGIQLRGTGFGASPNTETFDPATNAFTEGPRMVAASGRWLHTATVLLDGRVLLVGGRDNNCAWASLDTAEIYDPASGAFTPTGSLRRSRFAHTATRLADGRVLVLGGTTTEDLGVPTDQVTSAEVWDPATGEFSPAGATREGRSHAALVTLNDGLVLLVSGFNLNGSPVATTELYDPETGISRPGPEGSDWRYRATATKLRTGEVLVVGGNDSGAPVLAVDLFH